MKDLIIKYKKYISYIFFGVLTTVVYFISYGLFRFFGLSEFWATVPAWFFSVLFAFVTNKIFVFESKTKGFSQFFGEMLKFFAARVFSLGVDLAVTWFFIDVLNFSEGWREWVVKIISNIIVLILNLPLMDGELVILRIIVLI